MYDLTRTWKDDAENIDYFIFAEYINLNNSYRSNIKWIREF